MSKEVFEFCEHCKKKTFHLYSPSGLKKSCMNCNKETEIKEVDGNEQS